MIRLLIVDDEPLVQVGMKSILDWSSYGIEICAAVSNGSEALLAIEKYRPEIVISDIRMPVMDGLLLLKTCRDRYGDLPVFIMLTSYEDFSYAREAIHYGVDEYMLKLELSPQNLDKVINSTLLRVKNLKQSMNISVQEQEQPNRFFIRLLYGLFENSQQFRIQKDQLAPDIHYEFCVCGYGCILPGTAIHDAGEPPKNLYRSVLAMCQELCGRYFPCHTCFLNRNNFVLLIGLTGEQAKNYKTLINKMFLHIREALYNYFSVSLLISFGTPAADELETAASFSRARADLFQLHPDQPLVFSDPESTSVSTMTFDFRPFQSSLRQILDEFQFPLFQGTVRQMMHTCQEKIESLSPEEALYTTLDLTMFVFHLLIAAHPAAEQFLSETYAMHKHGYLSAFSARKPEELLSSLELLLENMEVSSVFGGKPQRQHVISQIQEYMQEHCTEKLSLNDVASAFGLSPNYLSTLFTKNCGYSFTEYMNHIKIEEAKKLLTTGNLRIYEIAEYLGFENAFYFSKVFKKAEGVSPREYQNRKFTGGTDGPLP